MFLNKSRIIFCVPDTKFVSATNVARAGKRGNICVGNNVSSFARAFKVQDQSKILIQTNYSDCEGMCGRGGEKILFSIQI